MKKLSIVELLRGVASLSVAMFHFCGQFTSTVPFVITRYGWLGVDVFFVISGFVIPLSLSRSGYSLIDFPLFFFRRIVRIEVPYVVSIIGVIFLSFLSSVTPGFRGSAPHFSLLSILENVFYLVPLTSSHWISPVYWSLAYEFCFYLVAGVFFPLVGSRHPSFTILAGIFAEIIYWRVWGVVDVRIWEFVIGVLLMRSLCGPRNYSAMIILMLACISAAWIGDPLTAVVVSATAVAIYAFRSIEFGQWAFRIGALSYSLYLVHVPIGGRIINLGKRLGDGPILELFVISAALATSITAAAIFMRYIERPALRASRAISRSAAEA